MIGGIVWGALGLATAGAWLRNWPSHVRHERQLARVGIAVAYALAEIVCVAGVIGSLAAAR